MLGIYVLLILVSQFGNVTSAVTLPSEPVMISATFSELKGVGVGTPVVAGGDVVGEVTEVEAGSYGRGAQRGKCGAFDVKLTIRPQFGDALYRGTVALISTPRTSAKRMNPEPVVELLAPATVKEVLPSGTKIRGYDSFEKFWAS